MSEPSVEPKRFLSGHAAAFSVLAVGLFSATVVVAAMTHGMFESKPGWIEVETCEEMSEYYPEIPHSKMAFRSDTAYIAFLRLDEERWSRVVDVSSFSGLNFQVTDTTHILPEKFPKQDVVVVAPGGHVDIKSSAVAFKGAGCVLISAKK